MCRKSRNKEVKKNKLSFWVQTWIDKSFSYVSDQSIICVRLAKNAYCWTKLSKVWPKHPIIMLLNILLPKVVSTEYFVCQILHIDHVYLISVLWINPFLCKFWSIVLRTTSSAKTWRTTKTHSEPSGTSKIELFSEIDNDWKLLTIFAKTQIFPS